MVQEQDSPIVTFITWKPAFDCVVNLMNCQHQGILRFINDWYNDIYYKKKTGSNVFEYMNQKFNFLQEFSDTHFVFEDTLLSILKDKFQFPEKVYSGHLAAHTKFIENFMQPLAAQINVHARSRSFDAVENITTDALRDVAHWWYSHIKEPSDKKACSYDHYYRVFIERLPERNKIELFNDLIMFLERCPQRFSCATW